MEWDFCLRMLFGWILWGLPIIAVIVVGAMVFPFLFLAGVGLRLWDAVHDKSGRRRGQAEAQLATAVSIGRPTEVVDVFDTTRPVRKERSTAAAEQREAVEGQPK